MTSFYVLVSGTVLCGTVGMTGRGRGIVGRGVGGGIVERGVHGGIVGRGGGRSVVGGIRGNVRGRVGMSLQGTGPIYIYLLKKKNAEKLKYCAQKNKLKVELHLLFVLIEPGQDPTQAQRKAAEVYFGRGMRTDSGGTRTLRDMIRETASKGK